MLQQTPLDPDVLTSSSSLLSPDTITVRDAAGLKSALAAAQGGETIVLQDGDYGTMALSGSFGAEVMLVSENLHGARFTGLKISGSSHLTLDGLHLDYVAGQNNTHYASPFKINTSSHITLRNSLIDGDDMLKAADAGTGYPTGRGLIVGKSQDIVIENNEVRTFWKGIGVGTSSNVTLRGNDIHDMRSDGINVAASNGVVIEANQIHDFRVNPLTGDHPDMIQIYSSAHSTVPQNIVIRDNFLNIGDGTSTQGIFITHNVTSKTAHGADVAFENISVTDNVIVNGHVNGLVVDTTHNLVVANNTLLTPPEAGLNAPRLSVDTASTGVTLTGNIAEVIHNLTTAPSDWTVSGNVRTQHDAAHLPGYYDDIFLNAMSDTTVLENLALQPHGAAALAGAGSAMLYDVASHGLTALVSPTSGEFRNEIVFDASHSIGVAGPAEAEGAIFKWDFGDGRTDQGVTVAHAYDAPGIYTAVLTMVLPDGRTSSREIISRIDGPDLLTYASDLGQMLIHDANGSDGFAVGAPGAALHFTSDTMVTVPKGSISRLEGAESLTIVAQLRADGAGILVDLHTNFRIAITQQGELKVGLGGTQIATTGADLLDQQWHDITVTFDGDAGTLSVSVDGIVLSNALAASSMPDTVNYDLNIGARDFRGGGFSGELTRFDLDVNPAQYDFTGADPVPIPIVVDEPLLIVEEPLIAAEAVVSGHMEVGTIDVGQDSSRQWHSIDFTHQIADARVVMGPLSFNGGDPAMVRVRNVTESGFEFQIDEWDYRDGRHPVESVSWFAGSEGSYNLASGQAITLGRTDLKDSTYKTVALTGFDDDPAVFTQVSSANGRDAVTTRVSGVDSDGFSVRMQEQEASDGKHLVETVDWMAIEPLDTNGSGEIAVGNSRVAVDVAALTDTFAFLAGMQTENGSDPATLRYDPGQNGMTVWLQEEASRDSEMHHLLEDVAYLSLAVGDYDLFA